MSKGSKRRPKNITDEEEQKAWDRIFKTTIKVRKEESGDKPDTVKPKKDKDRWLDSSSDC